MPQRVDLVDTISLSDDLIVLRDGSMRRQSADDLASQISATGPLADAISGRADQASVDALDVRLTAQEQITVTGATYLDEPVVVWSDADITLSGLQTIDGVALSVGDRVGVGGQASAGLNGVWVASDSAWTRAPDMDAAAEVDRRAVQAAQGTEYAGSVFLFSVDDAVTFSLNSDPITARQIASSAGFATSAVIAGLEDRLDDLEDDGSFEEALDGTADHEKLVDADDNVLRRVEEDGMMTVPHLDGTVQEEIRLRSSQLGGTTPGGDILQVHDAGGNVAMRIGETGAAYVPGARGGLQHELRIPLDRRDKFSGRLRTSRDALPASVTALTTNLHAQGLPFIEPPPMLVPNAYDVPDAVLGAISLADDNPVAQLPFPYFTGGAVHPFILPVRKPLFGYDYLLTDCCHAYAAEACENAIVFGTNDMETFHRIDDVPSPLFSADPGTGGRPFDSNASDPFFAYDPVDGSLIWGARRSWDPASPTTPDLKQVRLSRTYDGRTWTPLETFDAAQGLGLSTAMLYDPVGGLWHLWEVSTSVGTLAHSTGPSPVGPWTLSSTTEFNSAFGLRLWHMEVKFLGNRFALCGHTREDNSAVFLALSSDGDNWVCSADLVSPTSNNIYKPSFYVEFDGTDLMRFVFLWAHWRSTPPQTLPEDTQIYVQRSSWIDLTAL